MAATSPPPPPLARKREVGVVLGSFHSRWPPHHHHHPLSLANARWGWFLVPFTRDGRHVTTTTPSRSQTRVGGVSWFVFLGTAATSPPPPPLACKRELGVVPALFLSQRPPHHHSLGNNGVRRCTSPQQHDLVSVDYATGATSPPPPPLALKREVGVVLGSFHSGRPPRLHRHPLLLANASWGWFLFISCPFLWHHPPPSPQQRDGGGFSGFALLITPPSPQTRVGGIT
jgi:hypothetical protein